MIAAVVAFATTVSCAPKSLGKKIESVVTECALPENQANSLQGHWTTLPIKISFKVGDWDAAEVTEIQAGAETWNKFYEKSKGLTIFDFGSPGNFNGSTANQTTPACAGSTLSDGTVIYKRFNWTKSPTAIAVTSTCLGSSSGGLARIFNAIMEFNYVNFFVSSTGKFPDVQSIAVHELGHLVGLDHSCGPLGKPNVGKPNATCPDPNASPGDPLVTAVMFRNVLFDGNGTGEVKRELQANDQGRANCLYNAQ